MRSRITRGRLFVLVASSAIAFSQPVLADNGFILKKGKEYPICNELIKIVNLPENANAIGERTKIKDIIFPKDNKNFESVIWQPITIEEAKGLFLKGYLDIVMNKQKGRALNIEKDWDGKGDFSFEKTSVIYDKNDPTKKMIRYRLPTWGMGNCILSLSENEPDSFDTSFNDKNGNDIMGRNCGLFKYGGRIYLENSDLGYMYVNKLNPLPHWKIDGSNYTYANLYPEEICEIQKIKQ
jgi:hypothetical protein